MKDLADTPKSRSRNRRWVVPAAVIAISVGFFNYGPSAASADTPKLPNISSADLLAKVQTSKVQGLSGEAKSTANLGLPDLGNTYANGPSWTNFLTGDQTVRIWASDTGSFKLQLPSQYSETDVVHNAQGSWIWQSQGQKAEKLGKSGAATKTSDAHAANAPTSTDPKDLEKYTPETLANNFLSAVDSTTGVALASNVSVAGRSAYQLTLTPKESSSLIADVRIAIDSTTYQPLRVQVYAKGQKKVAYQFGFNSVKFNRPSESTFNFTPPPSAKITDGNTTTTTQPGANAKPAAPALSKLEPTIVGKGWGTILVTPSTGLPIELNAPADKPTDSHDKKWAQPSELQTLLKTAQPVSGAFGNGKLFHAALLNVVLTDDGRLAIGSVDQATLLAAIPPKS